MALSETVLLFLISGVSTSLIFLVSSLLTKSADVKECYTCGIRLINFVKEESKQIPDPVKQEIIDLIKAQVASLLAPPPIQTQPTPLSNQTFSIPPPPSFARKPTADINFNQIYSNEDSV